MTDRIRAWSAVGLKWALVLFACAGVPACASLEGVDDEVRYYNDDGIYLFGKGDYIRARESFELALALKPDDPAILYNLGQCLDRDGEVKGAENCYRQCLSLDPDHAPTRHALAKLLSAQNRPSESDEVVQGWLASQPKLADPYVEDARRLQKSGDLLKTQARLQQALEREPDNVMALTQMGILYELLERPDRALALYKKAAWHDPEQTFLKERIDLLLSRGVRDPIPD